MKKNWPILLMIVLVQSLVASAQPVSVDGYLVLNGERFKNQKIVLTKADGDWFVTDKDAHGAITFDGQYDGRIIHLNIEWDGKDDSHLVTDEIRHDPKRLGEFILTMEDKAVYGDGLNAYPLGEDQMHIKINRISEANVSGEWSGTIEQGSEKVKVSGVFNLTRKEGQKKLVNSSYKDCDNVIHDKLIGAEGRSPSECEAKFDLDVRTTIGEALAPVLEKFKNEDWLVQSETSLEPLLVVGRGSEKYIFSTQYNVRLQVNPGGTVYAGYKKGMDDFTEKFQKAVQSANGDKSLSEQFSKFTHEMYAAVNLEVGVFVNNTMFSTGNYKGGTKVTKLSEGVFKIESPYTQARTGGGEENSVDATFLLIGNWKQPVVKKTEEGDEIQAFPILNPSASHLQTQNMFIRIEGNAANANELIKNLDLQKLQSLINR